MDLPSTAQGKSDELVWIYSAVPSGQQIPAIAQRRRTHTNASNVLSAIIFAQAQSKCSSHNCRTENKQPLMQECRSPASIPSRRECHHHLSFLFFVVLSFHMILQSTLFECSGPLDGNALGRQTKMCSCPLLPHMLAWYFICLTVFNRHGTAEDAA